MGHFQPIWFVLLVGASSLAGCAPRVPPTPPAARHQQPGGVPSAAWRGQGRLELVFPGVRLSVDCWLDHSADGRLRAALVGDGGVLIAEFTAAPRFEVIRALDRIRPRLPLIANLCARAWTAPPRVAGTWHGGVLIADDASLRRSWGGDPLVLRRIDGPGCWPVTLADFQVFGAGLMAHQATASAPIGHIRIQLNVVQAAVAANSP